MISPMACPVGSTMSSVSIRGKRLYEPTGLCSAPVLALVRRSQTFRAAWPATRSLVQLFVVFEWSLFSRGVRRVGPTLAIPLCAAFRRSRAFDPRSSTWPTYAPGVLSFAGTALFKKVIDSICQHMITDRWEFDLASLRESCRPFFIRWDAAVTRRESALAPAERRCLLAHSPDLWRPLSFGADDGRKRERPL